MWSCLFHMWNPQEFMFAEFMDTSNVEQIQEFMEESIKGTAVQCWVWLMFTNKYMIPCPPHPQPPWSFQYSWKILGEGVAGRQNHFCDITDTVSVVEAWNIVASSRCFVASHSRCVKVWNFAKLNPTSRRRKVQWSNSVATVLQFYLWRHSQG